jgi:signal transduction histidine kinase
VSTVSAHTLIPLIAFVLNVCLGGISLLRNAGSRLNRSFVYLLTSLMFWSFGSFMLRNAPTPESGYAAEVIIHVGIVALPVLYYHFVLIFLDATTRRRPSLVVGYLLGFFFMALDLTGSRALMTGVTQTYWGWAPAAGPLYLAFFVYLYAFLVYGLRLLLGSYRGAESSFRRNRTLLLIMGTIVSLAGGLFDFVRFIVARFIPQAEHIYPVGIPANMCFALLMGISIVRYRLFDVSVAVKKGAVYGLLTGVFATLLGFVFRALDPHFDVDRIGTLELAIPVAVLFTLLVGPLGRRIEKLLEHVIFSRRRGCYDTLLALSSRMGMILDSGRLMDTLVRGLVHGIPVTHVVLLIHDPELDAFVLAREGTATDQSMTFPAVRTDSPIVDWLRQHGEVLVREELKVNPELAEHFEGAETELEESHAALIVPLKVEHRLTGILLLGEKLSGEIFDGGELEVLSVLANHAAIALQNARLYDELAHSNVRLAHASRLKSQFVASMSHELRTPLNSIIGFSRVLLKRLGGDLTERQEAQVQSIHKSGQHLLRLINAVLDISRIEAGKAEVRTEDVDLAALVEESIELSAPLVRDKALAIETEIAPEVPPVAADRTKVRQILLNLLSNAIKFTEAGRILVRLAVEASAVHVSVSDTGIGIRRDELERLFEPFERLGQPGDDVGGTGLGLALTKKLVELHGGQIWADTVENVGSTFHFTLPLAGVAVAGGTAA